MLLFIEGLSLGLCISMSKELCKSINQIAPYQVLCMDFAKHVRGIFIKIRHLKQCFISDLQCYLNLCILLHGIAGDHPNEGFEVFHTFFWGGVKGQSLLKFDCLF